MTSQIFAGVDEVGRGCLAGPVVSVAIILDRTVDKTLMAPTLINNKKNLNNSMELTKYENVKKTIKNYQKFIKDNFKYVGENFAYEARSIHYDKKKKSKGIYGNASKKDLNELKEEGIDTQMIPWIEDKDN